MHWGRLFRTVALFATPAIASFVACSSDDATFDDPSSASTAGPGGSGGHGGEGGDGTTSAGGSEPECPHEGPPLIDPASLPTCEGYDQCRCIPSSLIPPENLDDLGDCDADNKCVPDLLVATNGNFIPTTCESVGGFEGRCLSECLPAVADQVDLLPVDICEAGDRCVPCYDPFDGTETGACSQSCDPGPVDPPGMFSRCCSERGSCIPSASIPPDDAENLGEDSCPMGQDMLCVPDGFADGTFQALSCETSTALWGIFGDEYKPGACLHDCLPATDNFVITQGACPDGFKCAPCLDPLNDGAPTGACDFL